MGEMNISRAHIPSIQLACNTTLSTCSPAGAACVLIHSGSTKKNGVWKTKSKLEEGVMPARVAQWGLAPLMDAPLRSQELQPMNQDRIFFVVYECCMTYHHLQQLNTPNVVHHDFEWQKHLQSGLQLLLLLRHRYSAAIKIWPMTVTSMQRLSN